MSHKFYIAIFFVLICSFSAQAKMEFKFTDTYLGPTNFNRFLDTYQTDDSGTMNSMEFRPGLLGGLQFDYHSRVHHFFEAGALFPETGRDANISKWIYFFITNIGYSYRDWTFKLGAGFVMTQISSDGGTETLRNGTGSTDFPLPEESSTARNMILNSELEYFFLSNWSAKFSYQIYNITDSQTREYGNMITVVYHFWEKDWKLWKK